MPIRRRVRGSTPEALAALDLDVAAANERLKAAQEALKAADRQMKQAAKEARAAAAKRRKWSKAYKLRIKRAMAKGLTRQQARGHKPGEARRRRERELKAKAAKPDLSTSRERAAYARFIRQQVKRPMSAHDRAEAVLAMPRMRAELERLGWERFQELRATVRQWHREGTGAVGDIHEIEHMANYMHLDGWMLFYH